MTTIEGCVNRRARDMSIQTKPSRVIVVDEYESVPVNAKPTLETKVAAEEFCDMFGKALKRDKIECGRPILLDLSGNFTVLETGLRTAVELIIVPCKQKARLYVGKAQGELKATKHLV
jgi:hypothetical protein